MCPSAKELVGSSKIPVGSKFTVSEEGAARINEHLNDKVLKPGEVLTHIESYQEKDGGDPMYNLQRRKGCITVPMTMDAFSNYKPPRS